MQLHDLIPFPFACVVIEVEEKSIGNSGRFYNFLMAIVLFSFVDS